MSNLIDLNIMFDLETLGVSPGSTILSIGAVTFDEHATEFDEYYIEINPAQPGRSIEISTLQFWFKQQKDTGIGPPLSGTNRVDLAVYNFFGWIKEFKQQGYNPILWANGIDFDWGLIKEVAAQYEMQSPIAYNAVRDYRTLAKLYPDVDRPEMPAHLAHNALEDAKAQAIHCREILKHIGYWQRKKEIEDGRST